MFFDETVKFYGTYRPYQQRVLDNLNSFLDNEKIHIVAAPGSGKTILGLELIKRLDKASLVLVPSIAIREQWIERFSSGFLKDPHDKDKWISNDIKIQKPIICITYQALYSAYKKEKNNESIDDISNEDNDYKDFNLLETLKKYNIQTVCLDECHHLKAEWWKVLETLIKQLKGCSLIALTATPPYDSNIIEWQRYISLCGPIDEEIIVPELINDNNLCPHHDFIYFSFPTIDEERIILKSYANGIKVFNKYKNHTKLIEIIKENQIYKDHNSFKKIFYEDEEYYTSLILFLLENKVKVPFFVKLLVHFKKFEIKHFEILLQRVLFDDSSSYKNDALLLSMKKEFSALGVVHNRKVCLVHDDKINKLMTMSLSKLDSIKTIISSEIDSMKENMRCLILTDYIKQKAKSYIGNNKEIDSFGTLPIFEYLRRQNIENVSLCCLSGSICIVPKKCKDLLKDFETVDINDDYVEIIIQTSNRKQLVMSITKLFEQGEFNVLIGTKSLLGEGWDSPCINTLILASFIGSYVLSNQMRGRAIRTSKTDLNKKSNVWHLVCLNPFDYNYSYDYYNLQKRFSTFVGVNINKQIIENGIERLGINRIPYTSYEANKINKIQLEQSKNRDKIKQVWDNCIANAKQLDSLTKLTIIPRKRNKKEFSFYSSLIGLVLSIFTLGINYNFYLNLINENIKSIFTYIITGSISLILLYYMITYLLRFIRLLNPEIKLYTLSKAMLKALQKNNIITSKKIKVKVKRKSWNYSSLYLLKASTYEQNIFSECISQLLSFIDQPRYLIAKPRRFLRSEYYVIPDIFKRNKESVKILEKELAKKIGHFQIIFAKNEVGKNEVIKAQQLYYIKYRKVEITTKNILLATKRKNERKK